MKIGLVDVDNYNNLRSCFPNLVLMKISAYHKTLGDQVEWYDPLFGGQYNKVYMSKVFSFTEEYPYYINADEVIKGGIGYCISLVDGKEVFDKTKDIQLPYHIEHIMPDYSLYGITDTAYGFMSRGCPRGCGFCHVKDKEGLKSYKVADLSEFWDGQKYIELFDPNTLACKDYKDILQQLADSKAYVDFNQGIDIRMMTEEKAELIKQIKVKYIHFAFDRYQDKNIIMPKLKQFVDVTGWDRHKVSVYVLCGFDTTMEQNLERIMYLRSLNLQPYVMLYDKEHIPKGHELRKLQRWVNNKFVFWKCDSFDDYMKGA
ncbi:MAG: hypothetical protein MJ007_02080 [Paludibacteraceae bacterium]|nr:hypothetical protein [Paludibacteraceae bacterium]